MIEVKHLTKQYGGHIAVNDLSFSIEQGQIYGFLGPNGAGKSTTMNIITGCLAATSGQVTVGGHDIFEAPQEAKRLIGYLPEQPPLYPEMTPEEYLCFVAQAKGHHPLRENAAYQVGVRSADGAVGHADLHVMGAHWQIRHLQRFDHAAFSLVPGLHIADLYSADGFFHGKGPLTAWS